MKVYVVYSGTYDDAFVDQIFSTRELAQQYIDLTDEAIDYNTMPGWSLVTSDLVPHLRIVEVEIDQMVPMMKSRKTIYVGLMDIHGTITFLYQKFHEIKNWDGNVYHLIAAYKDDKGKYYEYYLDVDWEQGDPAYYLVFKVMADSQESAINIVNDKRLELIDKGIFVKEVTESFTYIGTEGEDED
ncbi:MAG: hypothetical protein WC175_02820 [Candidatus Dojkabacteria bacterium]